jgi:TRAP-type C4-dicarboxylate transport system permease small subunit
MPFFLLLKKTCAVLNQCIEYSLFGLGFSMAMLVAVQVFCRYVLNSSLFWSEELARYMLVWLSFLGATVAYYRNVHPGVDILTSRMPATGQRISAMLVQLISMALAVVMIISGSQFAWFVRTQISPALSIHKWIILAIIPVSGVILFLYGLLFFLKHLLRDEP